jgi:hypothetical protein
MLFLEFIHKGSSYSRRHQHEQLGTSLYSKTKNWLESDACQNGLGGDSLTTGKAWHLKMPDHFIGQGLIGQLSEFLALV